MLLLGAAACGSSTTTATSPTTTTQNVITDVLTGTVQPPVNGSLQSTVNTFVVGQGGGTVTITLTSAIETLANGTVLSPITMGIGAGTPNPDGTCGLFANSFVTVQPSSSSTPSLQGSLSPGTFCVQVTDVTNQLGPVSYTVVVAHP